MHSLHSALLPEDGLWRLCNQAFERAHQRLDEVDATDPQALVCWLEGVVRGLDVSRSPSGAYRSQTWFSPGADGVGAVVGQLRACRSRVDVCVFTLSDDHISDAVLAAPRPRSLCHAVLLPPHHPFWGPRPGRHRYPGRA